MADPGGGVNAVIDMPGLDESDEDDVKDMFGMLKNTGGCEKVTDGEDDRNCLACDRSYMFGKSMVDPGERMAWGLPEGRGIYCGECFPTWRLGLKDDVEIAFLQAYLRDAGNKAEFNLMLLAWVSLRREGVSRMQKHVLMMRLESLKFVLHALGLPIRPFVVRVLGDGELPDFQKDAFRWLTVRNSLGEEGIALLDDVPSPPAGASIATRPVGSLPLYLGNAVLRTTCRAHKQAFDQQRPKEQESSSACAASVAPYTSPKKNKLEQFYELVESSVLVHLSKQDWVEVVKQTHFTTHITKISSMKQETALLKTDTDALDQLAVYSDGLAAWKGVIRTFLHIRLVKKPTLEKVLSLEPFLENGLVFLDKCTFVKPHKTLLALRCKTMFLQHFRTTKDFDASLQYIVENAGADGALDNYVLDAMPLSERTTQDDFFRKLVFLGLQHVFEQMGSDTDGEALAKISKQFLTFMESCYALGFEVDELNEDIRHFSVYLKTLVGGVSSGRARDAQQYLLQPRCTVFQFLLDETRQGQAMAAEVVCLLETAKGDNIGDQRLKVARDTLMAPEMLKLRVVDGKAQFHNYDLAWDESVWCILQECVGHFLECRRIWSNARSDEVAEEQGDELVSLVTDVIRSTHMAVCVKFTNLYKRHFEAIALIPAEDIPKNFTDVQRLTATIANQAFHHPSVNKVQTDFLKLYKAEALKWASNGKATFMRRVCDEGLAKELETKLAVLIQVSEVITAFGAFSDPRIAPPDTNNMHVWLDVSADVQSDPTTFMTAAMSLISAVIRVEESLPSTVFGLSGDQDFTGFVGHNLECMADLSFGTDNEVPLEDVNTFFGQTLTNNSLIDYCEGQVKDSYCNLMLQVWNSSELAAIHADMPKADIDRKNPRVSVKHLWDDAQVGKTRSAAISMYESSSELARKGSLPCAQVASVWPVVCSSLLSMGHDSIVGYPFLGVGTSLHPDEMNIITGLYADVNGILGALLYLDHATGQATAASANTLKRVLVDDKLAVGIQDSMEYLILHAQSVVDFLSGSDGDEHSGVVVLESLVLELPLSRIKAWLARVVAELPSVQELIMTKAMQEMQALAEAIKFPEYSHIVSDSNYAKELAKKYIIGFTRVRELELAVGRLYTSLFDIAGIVKSWGCGGILKDNEMYTATKALCMDQHSKGKKFLTVRAAVNIAEGLVEAEPTVIVQLIAKCGIPIALNAVLEKLVNAAKREHTHVVTFSKRDQEAAGLDDKALVAVPSSSSKERPKKKVRKSA